MLQPLSGRLQTSIRFLPPPVPAMLTVILAAHFPTLGNTTGLPRSASVPDMG
jgi:hypothetical protein